MFEDGSSILTSAYKQIAEAPRSVRKRDVSKLLKYIGTCTAVSVKQSSKQTTFLPQFKGHPNVPAVKQMFEADDILNDYPRPEASDNSQKVTQMFRAIVSTVGFILKNVIVYNLLTPLSPFEVP